MAIAINMRMKRSRMKKYNLFRTSINTVLHGKNPIKVYTVNNRLMQLQT